MIVSKQNLTGKLTDKQSIQGKINKATEYIEPITQEKTIVPTKQIQEVLPDENIDLLSKVIVNAIPNEYIIPQGEIEITENGVYDVAEYENADVNVSGGGGGAFEVPNGLKFSNSQLSTVPSNLDFSNVTDFEKMFNSWINLNTFPLIDTSKGKNFNSFCSNNVLLENMPILDFSNMTNNYNMFMGCTALTNESLNNILYSLSQASKIKNSWKNLKRAGLSSTQATTCQSLSNWDAFVSAGWSTGY